MGRVVVPTALRDTLGLTPRSTVGTPVRVYDALVALVALAARASRLSLATRDARAVSTCTLVGVDVVLLG